MSGSGPGNSPATHVSVTIRTSLHGATPGAAAEFESAVQEYAALLASESQRQEISLRPAGVVNLEVSPNAVVRAKQAIARFGERAKPPLIESIARVALLLFTAATGVMGSFLHSPTQVIVFIALALGGLASILYLLGRRLLV